jgi:hypothetical protein
MGALGSAATRGNEVDSYRRAVRSVIMGRGAFGFGGDANKYTPNLATY